MKTLALLICIHLQIVDFKTKETLPAVTVKTDKATYYSDFDGNVDIPSDEKIININYISYQDLTDVKVTNDTIIALKSL